MEQQHVPWNFSRCGSTHTPFQLPVNCHSSKCRSSSFIVYRLPGGGARRLENTHTPPAYIPPNEPPTKQEGKSAPRDDDDDDAWASAAPIPRLCSATASGIGTPTWNLEEGRHAPPANGSPKKGSQTVPSRLLLAGKLFPSCCGDAALDAAAAGPAGARTGDLRCRNSRPGMRVCESVCASQHVRAVCLASEISSLRL